MNEMSRQDSNMFSNSFGDNNNNNLSQEQEGTINNNGGDKIGITSNQK